MICQNIAEFSSKLLPNQRLLGLDIGEKKIGIAISDFTRTIATPFSVIERKGIIQDIDSIYRLIDANDVTGVVAGLPVQMNGQEGDLCLKVRRLIDKLQERLEISVFFQDERLSTAAANRMLAETNLTRKKKSMLDDKIAASIILQTVLDSIKILNRASDKNIDY